MKYRVQTTVTALLAAAMLGAGEPPVTPTATPTPAPTATPTPLNNPWYEYPVGSWVITSSARGLGKRQEEQRQKKTIVRRHGDQLAVVFADFKDGRFEEWSKPHIHVDGKEPEELGMKLIDVAKSETLKIDGHSYECQVVRYAKSQVQKLNGRQLNVTRELALWVCPQVTVPYTQIDAPPPPIALRPNVLRAELTCAVGQERLVFEMEVTGLNETVKVADHKLHCVRQRVKTVAKGRNATVESEGYLLLCDDVPGKLVKKYVTGSFGDRSVKVVETLEDFEVAQAN